MLSNLFLCLSAAFLFASISIRGLMFESWFVNFHNAGVAFFVAAILVLRVF